MKNYKDNNMDMKRILFTGKNNVHRMMTYLAMTQSPLVIYLGLVQMYNGGIIPFNVNEYFILTAVVAGSLLLFLGWIETTYVKGYQEEQTIWFNRNPQLVEMKKDIEEIKELIKK